MRSHPETLHTRLERLPTALVLGRRVPVAIDRRSRLLGLAGVERTRAGAGLLLPACRSVHTFGMRFPLDVVFLDAELRPLSIRRLVPPNRIAFEPAARAVLEVAAPDETGGAA